MFSIVGMGENGQGLVDEASDCLLPRLALWDEVRLQAAGEGKTAVVATALSCCLQHKLFPEGEPFKLQFVKRPHP